SALADAQRATMTRIDLTPGAAYEIGPSCARLRSVSVGGDSGVTKSLERDVRQPQCFHSLERRGQSCLRNVAIAFDHDFDGSVDARLGSHHDVELTVIVRTSIDDEAVFDDSD